MHSMLPPGCRAAEAACRDQISKVQPRAAPTMLATQPLVTPSQADSCFAVLSDSPAAMPRCTACMQKQNQQLHSCLPQVRELV